MHITLSGYHIYIKGQRLLSGSLIGSRKSDSVSWYDGFYPKPSYIQFSRLISTGFSPIIFYFLAPVFMAGVFFFVS